MCIRTSPRTARQTARAFLALALVAALSGCAGEVEPDLLEDGATAAAPAAPSAPEITSTPSPPRTGAQAFTLDGVHRFAIVHERLRASGIETGELAAGSDPASISSEVRLAVDEAGLTMDEFLAMNSVLLPALFVARLREAGLPSTALPPGMEEADVMFVEEHRVEIEALLGLEER